MVVDGGHVNNTFPPLPVRARRSSALPPSRPPPVRYRQKKFEEEKARAVEDKIKKKEDVRTALAKQCRLKREDLKLAEQQKQKWFSEQKTQLTKWNEEETQKKEAQEKKIMEQREWRDKQREQIRLKREATLQAKRTYEESRKMEMLEKTKQADLKDQENRENQKLRLLLFLKVRVWQSSTSSSRRSTPETAPLSSL